MDDDLKHDFPESRPSGVLGSSSGTFSIGKFLAITAALAAAGGVGAVAYKTFATPDPAPQPVAPPVVATPPAPPPEAKAEPVVPPARMDIGPPRLDIPDPSWDDPKHAPAPGPEVETPDW